MITKIKAILSLVPNAQVTIRNDVVQWHEPSTAPVTDEQITAEVARLQAEYDNNEYQRQRAQAYPPIADQLDKIYHEGIDAWKAQIAAVKQECPKP